MGCLSGFAANEEQSLKCRSLLLVLNLLECVLVDVLQILNYFKVLALPLVVLTLPLALCNMQLGQKRFPQNGFKIL
jgi:hypothetical protein